MDSSSGVRVSSERVGSFGTADFQCSFRGRRPSSHSAQPFLPTSCSSRSCLCRSGRSSSHGSLLEGLPSGSSFPTQRTFCFSSRLFYFGKISISASDSCVEFSSGVSLGSGTVNRSRDFFDSSATGHPRGPDRSTSPAGRTGTCRPSRVAGDRRGGSGGSCSRLVHRRVPKSFSGCRGLRGASRSPWTCGSPTGRGTLTPPRSSTTGGGRDHGTSRSGTWSRCLWPGVPGGSAGVSFGVWEKTDSWSQVRSTRSGPRHGV